MERWINPKYADTLTSYEDTHGEITASTGDNCGNCSGVGRHIYIDSDGTTKDIPCMACQGSGQNRL